MSTAPRCDRTEAWARLADHHAGTGRARDRGAGNRDTRAGQ
jgi:glucose-6-phosphate isomerase